MTFPEVLLWQKLKGKQLMGYDFDRQVPIDAYIVDFYCKDLKLAIEVDGSDHEYDKDKIREERLKALGVNFLRFTNSEMKYKMVDALSSITNWIEAYIDKSTSTQKHTN